jgi:hypothetical protein
MQNERLPLANISFIIATLGMGLLMLFVMNTASADVKGSTMNAFPYANNGALGADTAEAANRRIEASQKLDYPMAVTPSPQAVLRSMGQTGTPPVVAASIPKLNTQPEVRFPEVKNQKKLGFFYKLFHSKKAEKEKIAVLSGTPTEAPIAVIETGGSHMKTTANGVEEVGVLETALIPPTSAGNAPTAIAMASLNLPTASVAYSGISLPAVWSSNRPIPTARERALIQLIQYTNKTWDDENAHRLAYLILQSCDAHRIDYRIMASLLATESSFRLDAVSRTGAKGLGQLKDATAQWLGVRDAFDPVDNLNGTAKYLSFLADQFPNEPAKAVASYFVGQGTVKRDGLNDGAIRYILKVQSFLDVIMQMENQA